jgi:methylthioribose-1-phosphate isomerase
MTVSFDQNSHLVQSANITAESFNIGADTVSFTPPRGLRAGTYTVIVLFEYGNGKFFASAPKSYVNK